VAEGEAPDGNIVEVAWTRHFNVADNTRPRPRDINGDGRADAFFDTIVSDDAGNKVELWGINTSWFATLFNDKYLVGRCPYDSGVNSWRMRYVKDLNGNGKPDALLSVTHTSRESRDEVGLWLWWGGFYAVRGLERMEYQLNVPNPELTVTQLTSSGAVIKRDIQCPRLATGNQAPIAEAGPEQWRRDQDGNGFEAITLNGSASSDPDGVIRNYEWTEGGRVLGNTPILTTNLGVGWHKVTLSVTDCAFKTSSNTVIINVLPPPPTPVQVRVGQPYFQDFSSGIPGSPQGWESYSTSEGRIAVVNGRLRMDDRVNNSTYSQNEAILHVNLLGQSNVQLSGNHWNLSDEVHPGDGIAISADGVTWHRVTAFNVSSTGAFLVKLDAAVTAAGISYTSDFQIKFQQYDNSPARTDGREWDDIRVEVVPPPTPQIVRLGQPYFQDFSAGRPGSPQGWEYRSTNEGRISVVGGRLRMDDGVNNGTYSQNEAILHVNLLGQSKVRLSGNHWNLSDEAHPGDGIFISADGVTWHRVAAFNVASTGAFLVDLDAAIAAAGIIYTSDFRIKFQQYDNGPTPTDGREWGNIRVELL
jgi:hypothetical protein